MAPPHRQNNCNHRYDRNRSPHRTSWGQTGGPQNEDTRAAQRAVDEAIERHRQAQRQVDEAMERQRQAQREVDGAMERQRQAQREVDEAMKRQRQGAVQREVARAQSLTAPPTDGQTRGGSRGSQSQTRSHRIPSVASNRNTSALRQASRPTGITKPQQTPSVGLRVPMSAAPEAEGQDFVAGHHRTAHTGVVNQTLGTGGQHHYHFPASTGFGGMYGVTSDTNYLKAVGDHVEKVNQCSGVSYRVEPSRNDAQSFMENEEKLVRVTTATGRTANALGEPSRIETSRQPSNECVYCKSKTHTLRHCLDADEGMIYGCVICNKDDHLVDECHQFRDMSLKQQVELLVFDRANMPRLAVSKGFPKWYDLLERAISSGDIDDKEPMKGFPWTGKFCTEICYEGNGGTIKALQEQFDESGFDTSILPVDSNRASLRAVRNCYDYCA
ncbi:uncharacterized protein FFB20_14865 [Fusarium fujikuroi]|nr:Uncharacterized protein Y057_7555 [Fusarium fujikuroi]SCO15905.1 uncharacterized protein FFB20_14865 [Fusarium fujikuroi]SCO20722.1 uncharacterized protein FFC1_13819 [Fusarium fujikuroi]SCO45519.1 uncharacterized protein FFNC_10338 [Fusarium fujikuroi]